MPSARGICDADHVATRFGACSPIVRRPDAVVVVVVTEASAVAAVALLGFDGRTALLLVLSMRRAVLVVVAIAGQSRAEDCWNHRRIILNRSVMRGI